MKLKFVDMYDSARPYTASFVILRRGNKIAMVLRQNTPWMNGYYGLPAGKIEWDETFLEGAVREAKEEAGVGVKPSDMKMVHVVYRHGLQNDGFMDWVDMYFEAKQWEGEPHNAEPEKSEKLDWLDLDNLPDNIVPPQQAALLAIQKGQLYSEYGFTE